MKRKFFVADLVSSLVWTNIELWHEEDKARLSDDSTVVKAKRSIDRLNQKRNDLIESIDDAVIQMVKDGRKDPSWQKQ